MLREADRQLGLTRKLAACIPDPRNPLLTVHDQHTMLAQRIFGIALGYEDLNDHDTLRDDPLFALMADKQPVPEQPLASPPTLCRLENRIDAQSLFRMSQVLVETFIASHKRPPKELILDRFLHHADVVTITGRSYRLKNRPTAKKVNLEAEEACQEQVG